MSDDFASDPDTAPGTLLTGRYRLERLIGSGASAHVYAAIDELLQLPIAIKILHDASAAERQIREASLAMSLNHPAIVRCHGSFVDGTTRFIVMELAEGESLAARLMRGSLTVDEALAVFTSVAEALQHAHDGGVLHRDITPANILTVVSNGSIVGARVIDFGIAKQLSPTSTLTETAGIGTLAYAAPEQLAGRPTTQSDLFALGAVLFHMLTSQPPTIGAERSIMQCLPSSTPLWLAKLTTDLLKVAPADRVPTATAALQIVADIRANPVEHQTIAARRRILGLGILLCISIAAASLSLTTLSDPGQLAGKLYSWMEQHNLVTWEDRNIVRHMALAACSSGDLASVDRIFQDSRLGSVGREQLLVDCLELAVQKQKLAAVQRLIDLGATVNAKNIDLVSRLFAHILRSRSPEMLHALVRRGFPIQRVFEELMPFTIAANERDPEMFWALLLELKKLPGPIRPSELPLWVAVVSGEPEAYIPLVVEAGADIVNFRDSKGTSALSTAILQLPQKDIRKMLQTKGIDLNQAGNDGNTALLFALSRLPHSTSPLPNEQLEIAEYLIAAGADVNAKNGEGVGALAFAAELQLLPIVKQLLNRPEIEIDAVDNRGNTPLYYAIGGQHNFTPAIAELLVERHAAVDRPNLEGRTVRDIARQLGREQYLETHIQK